MRTRMRKNVSKVSLSQFLEWLRIVSQVHVHHGAVELCLGLNGRAITVRFVTVVQRSFSPLSFGQAI